MQDKYAAIFKKLSEDISKVRQRRKQGPDQLKEKEKDKLSKIRNNIKRNSKK